MLYCCIIRASVDLPGDKAAKTKKTCEVQKGINCRFFDIAVGVERTKSLSYLLFYLCRLTDAITQIIKLAAADTTVAGSLYLNNIGRMYGENSLHAYAVRNTADGKGLGNAEPFLAMMVPSNT